MTAAAWERDAPACPAAAVIDEVRAAVDGWKGFAEQAGVSKARSREIEASFPRLSRPA